MNQTTIQPDGYTYIKQEAQGLVEMAKAYGALADVMGGPAGLLQYMMLQNNTYERLANANARAINGLQPKINVWNTGAAGSEGGAAADPAASLRNIFQTLPPLLSTINDQTGIAPPAWFAQMPAKEESSLAKRDTKRAPVAHNGVNGAD